REVGERQVEIFLIFLAAADHALDANKSLMAGGVPEREFTRFHFTGGKRGFEVLLEDDVRFRRDVSEEPERDGAEQHALFTEHLRSQDVGFEDLAFAV